LIINVLFFLATIRFSDFMVENFALYYPWSSLFRPHQIVTHMFMHDGDMHIFGNMLALFFFGPMIEERMGSKRFLIYYVTTGLGAMLLHVGVTYVEMLPYLGSTDPNVMYYLENNHVLGASGAVFGVLMAAALLFPERRIVLLFPPIPMKIQHLVMVYGAYEVWQLIQNNPNDSVAHFAHVGGMLFGYLIIRFWRKRTLF